VITTRLRGRVRPSGGSAIAQITPPQWTRPQRGGAAPTARKFGRGGKNMAWFRRNSQPHAAAGRVDGRNSSLGAYQRLDPVWKAGPHGPDRPLRKGGWKPARAVPGSRATMAHHGNRGRRRAARCRRAHAEIVPWILHARDRRRPAHGLVPDDKTRLAELVALSTCARHALPEGKCEKGGQINKARQIAWASVCTSQEVGSSPVGEGHIETCDERTRGCRRAVASPIERAVCPVRAK